MYAKLSCVRCSANVMNLVEAFIEGWPCREIQGWLPRGRAIQLEALRMKERSCKIRQCSNNPSPAATEVERMSSILATWFCLVHGLRCGHGAKAFWPFREVCVSFICFLEKTLTRNTSMAASLGHTLNITDKTDRNTHNLVVSVHSTNSRAVVCRSTFLNGAWRPMHSTQFSWSASHSTEHGALPLSRR